MKAGSSGDRPRKLISGALLWVVLGAYLLWVVYPMIWLAASSLKPDSEIFRHPFSWPAASQLQWSNFVRAWREAHFSDYFVNSVVVTGSSVVAVVMFGAMAAYALSRFFHPAGKLIFWLFLAGLMIPMQLSVVPLFFQMKDLGLLNTRLGLFLVYTANGLPFTVFILAGFFRTLPRTYYEAAQIDGCGFFSTFWHVMLPLARPGMITVAIFQFINIWKEYFYAFMFLSGAHGAVVETLPLGLANLAISSQYHTDYGVLFAGLVIVTIPVLIVYLLLQKHLVKGITMGGLKG